jgi:uncharacterized membrane protein
VERRGRYGMGLDRPGLAGGSSGEVPPRAIDILNARYAKGEITREQFEQMKRDIGEAP